MEIEIKKLKELYLATPTPIFLDEKGFSDVLGRLRSQEKLRSVFINRLTLFASILIILLTSFTGLTIAAQPNTPLYQIKAATKNTFSKFIYFKKNNKLPKVQKIIVLKKVLPKIVTVTPSLVPKSQNIVVKHENKEIKMQQISLPGKTNNDVKGISIKAKEEVAMPHKGNVITTSSENKSPNSNQSSKNHENNSQNKSSAAPQKKN